MKHNHRNLRKAAILLASLSSEAADELLQQMSPSQAELLRRAVDNLAEIDPDEQSGVIEEFFRIGPLVPDKQPSGIELDSRLPKHLSVSSANSEMPDQSGFFDRRAPGPFRFLHETSPRALAPLLQREHPQTIAVVVSHLPSDRAAEVLAGLSADLQIEVARRLVDLDETDPEILREIETGLESWLGKELRSSQRRAAGITALTNILSAASPATKQSILNNLSRGDQRLANRLETPRRSTLTFGELEQFDAASLTVLVHHAEPEVLLLALAGSSVEFSARALESFGREDAEELRRALRELGPTRLSDVEEAQRALVELAGQLELRGDIAPHVRRQLSVAI